MLQAMLLAGIVAAPLGSVALFLPGRGVDAGASAWPAVRRFVLAVLGTAVLAAAAAGVLRALGASSHNLTAGVAGLIFASGCGRRSPGAVGGLWDAFRLPAGLARVTFLGLAYPVRLVVAAGQRERRRPRQLPSRTPPAAASSW